MCIDEFITFSKRRSTHGYVGSAIQYVARGHWGVKLQLVLVFFQGKRTEAQPTG